MNLVDGINEELNRARELLRLYEDLPPQSGWFGAAIVKQAIQHAESSIESLDPVEMLNAYEELKRLE